MASEHKQKPISQLVVLVSDAVCTLCPLERLADSPHAALGILAFLKRPHRKDGRIYKPSSEHSSYV